MRIVWAEASSPAEMSSRGDGPSPTPNSSDPSGDEQNLEERLSNRLKRARTQTGHRSNPPPARRNYALNPEEASVQIVYRDESGARNTGDDAAVGLDQDRAVAQDGARGGRSENGNRPPADKSGRTSADAANTTGLKRYLKALSGD